MDEDTIYDIWGWNDREDTILRYMRIGKEEVLYPLLPDVLEAWRLDG